MEAEAEASSPSRPIPLAMDPQGAFAGPSDRPDQPLPGPEVAGCNSPGTGLVQLSWKLEACRNADRCVDATTLSRVE
jgi:hypothetical protein